MSDECDTAGYGDSISTSLCSKYPPAAANCQNKNKIKDHSDRWSDFAEGIPPPEPKEQVSQQSNGVLISLSTQ
eukprot:scaffold286601_cov59-Attheya_sp.AAC.5